MSVPYFDAGEEMAEKTAPFHTDVQIILGAAEVVVTAKITV
jgi:hypothetical protein